MLSMPVTQIIELGGGTGRLGFRDSPIIHALATGPVSDRRDFQHASATSGARATGKTCPMERFRRSSSGAAKGEAILISNEFVDAFPCQRFEREAHGWKEISLALEGDLWREEYSESRALPDSSTFAVKYATGQRVETLQSYRNWLTRLARHLQRGAILTIDYGGSPEEIYHRRPGGTLRAYFRHQRIDGMGIYLRPGRQDLTADVNFVDLK